MAVSRSYWYLLAWHGLCLGTGKEKGSGAILLLVGIITHPYSVWVDKWRLATWAM